MADSRNINLRRWASIMGATGVAAGAFGAHALKDVLTKRGTTSSWNTAVFYQLMHATAILALSSSSGGGGGGGRHQHQQQQGANNHQIAGQLMGLGTLLFSGSLYGLSLGYGPKALLGPTTPIGGLFMIGGWIAIGFF